MSNDKFNKSLVKNILKEAESNVEPVDKIGLIQDLADIQTNMADSFSKLYQYKGQYIENENWRTSLSSLRKNISVLLTRVAETMKMIGEEGMSQEKI